MIGIIPAAGRGKRLGIDCKPLIRVNGKRLLEYPLLKMRDLGVKLVFIIVRDNQIPDSFGGVYEGMSLAYIFQTEQKGIAHAVSLVPEPSEDIVIILGDIIYNGSLKKAYEYFKENNFDAVFGAQPLYGGDDKITKSFGMTWQKDIIEKPKDVSNMMPFLGLGIYFTKPNFFEYIRQTPVSDLRGEVEITDTLNLIPKDKRIFYPLSGYYTNINTQEELEEAEREVARHG